MVEPLFRFDGQAQVGSVVTLDGPEGHHAAAVRRVRAGEAVQLTNGVTKHWRGVVESVAAKSLSIKISECSDIAADSLQFVLVQALAKGDRDELAIQAATELGISRVIPWQADRSVSKWDDTKAAKSKLRWQSICDEASKQALRPRFVEVSDRLTSRQLTAAISADQGVWLVLDPTAGVSLTDISLVPESVVHLLVGPEGGITELELAAFEQAGAKRVHLGQGILRTSTAGVAALSFLSAANGLWR